MSSNRGRISSNMPQFCRGENSTTSVHPTKAGRRNRLVRIVNCKSVREFPVSHWPGVCLTLHWITAVHPSGWRPVYCLSVSVTPSRESARVGDQVPHLIRDLHAPRALAVRHCFPPARGVEIRQTGRLISPSSLTTLSPEPARPHVHGHGLAQSRLSYLKFRISATMNPDIPSMKHAKDLHN